MISLKSKAAGVFTIIALITDVNRKYDIYLAKRFYLSTIWKNDRQLIDFQRTLREQSINNTTSGEE